MNEKEEIIRDIKVLISTADEKSVEINPNYLEYFSIEELNEIRDRLVVKKKSIREITSDFLDEIYDKTKKDEI